MPAKFSKRYKKKSYRKRRYKKKSYRKNTLSKITTPTPFPGVMRTKLIYSERVQQTLSSFTTLYQWNMNSLFDPNRTGTGSQPMFFDQLCQSEGPYTRYRVRSFGYEIILSNLNTPCRYAVTMTNNSSPTDVPDASEMRWSKTGIVNDMPSPGGIRKITGYLTLRALLGESIEDDRDQAQFNASPANIALLNLQLETLDGSTNITSVNYSLKLTYYCDLFDQRPVNGS